MHSVKPRNTILILRMLATASVCVLLLFIIEYAVYKMASGQGTEKNATGPVATRRVERPRPKASRIEKSAQRHSHGERISQTLPKDLLCVWREVAAKADIPVSARDITEGILKAAVAGREHKFEITSDEIGKLEVSLKRFVKAHFRILHDDQKVEGVCYWLSYCVLAALSRPSPPDKESKALLAEYASVARVLANRIDSRLKQVLNDADYSRWGKTIINGLREFEEEMIAKVKVLHADFMIPAFKNLPQPSMYEALFSEFDKMMEQCPAYEEPEILLVTKDDYFARRMDNFLTNCVHRAISAMFLKCIFDKVRHNPYWGKTDLTAVNDHGYWPQLVRLWPVIDQEKTDLSTVEEDDVF